MQESMPKTGWDCRAGVMLYLSVAYVVVAVSRASLSDSLVRVPEPEIERIFCDSFIDRLFRVQVWRLCVGPSA